GALPEGLEAVEAMPSAPRAARPRIAEVAAEAEPEIPPKVWRLIVAGGVVLLGLIVFFAFRKPPADVAVAGGGGGSRSSNPQKQPGPGPANGATPENPAGPVVEKRNPFEVMGQLDGNVQYVRALL